MVPPMPIRSALRSAVRAVQPRRHRGRAARSALLLGAGALVAAVGSPATAASAASRTQATHLAHQKTHAGKVIVLSAGSLETVMDTAIEAGFHKKTGYSVTDVSGGSTGLATDIKSGVDQADVFWSATPSADKVLMGSSNGKWVAWYVTFATSALVLGYESTDKYAATLTSKPWWQVITQPGFLVGRTNPVTDPKGRLAVAALKDSAKKHDAPTVGAIATKATTVFTETTLVGRLQAGQLDAGFFYAVEASAAHFPTVPLTGVTEKADYTLTVVAKAPHRAAADAFVSYLLSSSAKKLLAKEGLKELGTPVVTGKKSAVPKALRKVIN